jgi:PAS domain S-box-containing protein
MVVETHKLTAKERERKIEINTHRIDMVDKPVMFVSSKEIPTMHAGSDNLLQNENVFRNIFWKAPIMMMQLKQSGIIVNVNQLWVEQTGLSQTEVLGKTFSNFLEKQSAQKFEEEILSNPIYTDDIPEMLVTVLTGKGFQKSFEVRLSRFIETDGTLSIIATMFESPIPRTLDMDDESMLATALRDTAAALTSTLNFDEVLDQILMNVGQVVPNEAANVMMIWSGVAYIVRSTGYAERGLEDAMMSLQLPISQEPHLLSMYETGMPLAVKDTHEYAGLQHQDRADWARSIASAPLKSKGQVFGFLNLESSKSGYYGQKHADRLQAFADQAAVAIENARLYAEVQQYAITDELTTVYNRRGLFELGRREVERARRYGRSLSAIMIDTDKFKDINDNYSHSVGDQVLRIQAERIKTCIREVDILGRYGGDEFVILLPETDLSNALQVAERVAELSAEAFTFEILLEKADSAMFQAKAHGKNQVAS